MTAVTLGVSIGAIALTIAQVACTGGGAGIGERCDTSADCASGLQCLDGQCLPRCLHHIECGDGFVCDDGQCKAVAAGENEPCDSELDCGPGLTCRLRQQLSSPPGICQRHTTAGVPGASCATDFDCRGGACMLGHCLDLCADASECPPRWACAAVPRVTDDAITLLGNFNACLPGSGTLTYEIPLDETVQEPRVMVAVPSSAVAMSVVMEVADPFQRIGATHVEAPDGRQIYELPLDRETYFRNRLRHDPAPGVSAFKIPSRPDEPLQAGAYAVSLGVFADAGGEPSRARRLRVIEKLGLGAALDLHFYFTDLDDHPCADSIGAVLDAAGARDSAAFQTEFVAELRALLSRAFATGATTYEDVVDHPELAGLVRERAGELFELNTHDHGVAIFFVRSIAPAGMQIIVGGTPGAPLPGTRGSGVAVSLEAMCYRDWRTLARQTAHAVARQLGLFRNIEPDGGVDPIDDTPATIDNLMHFSEFGGTTLTPGQVEVLRASPAVQ
ncbi:MAG: hypothetical protein F9K40_11875 [Kofleriaceae bacterium]|nr:MAG: hypothetical protein F9K40_11875 [Kofleriaceae bacterium]MBZ0233617.1 hypothetical protein [Kofleriaceae bacterium]